jgi:hypothetical protein
MSTVQVRSVIHALAEDATGLREVRAQAEAVAQIAPTFEPHVQYVRAEQARLLGSHAEALAIVEGALAETSAGDRAIWPALAGAKVAALTALGRTCEAIEEGRRLLESGQRAGLVRACDFIEVPMALAQARDKDFDSAVARLDRVIVCAEALGTEGVRIGHMHEARAYVAAWMGDELGFAAHAHKCALQYKKSGGDPALLAKYEQLVRSTQPAAYVAPTFTQPLGAAGSASTSLSDTSSTQITALIDSTAEETRSR